MASHLQFVPNELLVAIFKECSKVDFQSLKNLRATCKSFTAVAEEFLYEEERDLTEWRKITQNRHKYSHHPEQVVSEQEAVRRYHFRNQIAAEQQRWTFEIEGKAFGHALLKFSSLKNVSLVKGPWRSYVVPNWEVLGPLHGQLGIAQNFSRIFYQKSGAVNPNGLRAISSALDARSSTNGCLPIRLHCDVEANKLAFTTFAIETPHSLPQSGIATFVKSLSSPFASVHEFSIRINYGESNEFKPSLNRGIVSNIAHIPHLRALTLVDDCSIFNDESQEALTNCFLRATYPELRSFTFTGGVSKFILLDFLRRNAGKMRFLNLRIVRLHSGGRWEEVLREIPNFLSLDDIHLLSLRDHYKPPSPSNSGGSWVDEDLSREFFEWQKPWSNKLKPLSKKLKQCLLGRHPSTSSDELEFMLAQSWIHVPFDEADDLWGPDVDLGLRHLFHRKDLICFNKKEGNNLVETTQFGVQSNTAA